MIKRIFNFILFVFFTCHLAVYSNEIEEATQAIQNKDYFTASILLNRLANQNHAAAQNNLAYMYQEGLGLKKDYSQALRWYLLASKNGLYQVNITIGKYYYSGYGTEVNYPEAFRFF